MLHSRLTAKSLDPTGTFSTVPDVHDDVFFFVFQRLLLLVGQLAGRRNLRREHFALSGAAANTDNPSDTPQLLH